MTPLDYYRKNCEEGIIFEDPEQLIVMEHLQIIYQNLLLEAKRRKGLFNLFRSPQLVKGLYLWGGVGIGKTFMMDCFYQSLPFPNKLRMHFYQFMQQIHLALKEHQGKKNPLQIIAKELAHEAMILCFDELFVSDIGDAMLLGPLLRALFANKVCLIATSNIAPNDLYKNGLQRFQFLPAIAALKENMTIAHISSTTDYRLRHLKEAGVFYTPLNEAAQQNMEKSFSSLSEGEKIIYEPLYLYDRPIKIIKRTKDIVWFDFVEICSVPRSQKDYLAIAKQFRTVFISNIPTITADEKNTICLFISLIDVFYDARTRLIISSAEDVAKIYSRGFMILEYTRTHSRLLEMQSTDYFTSEVHDE